MKNEKSKKRQRKKSWKQKGAIFGAMIAASVWIGHVLPHHDTRPGHDLPDEIVLIQGYEQAITSSLIGGCSITDPINDHRVVAVLPYDAKRDIALVDVKSARENDSAPKVIKCTVDASTWNVYDHYDQNYWLAKKEIKH
jgi:hypothetical protein